MSETQLLLGRIASLRRQFDPAPGDREVGERLNGRSQELPPSRLRWLEVQLASGAERAVSLDTSLKQFADRSAAAAEAGALPRQLTAKARRLLGHGRELLGRLRTLSENAVLQNPAEPLGGMYRDTTAIVGVALRMVQAFPDAPSSQLALCSGLEATLGIVERRIATLTWLVDRRNRLGARLEKLSGLLLYLHAGKLLDVEPLVGLVAELWHEAQQGDFALEGLQFVGEPTKGVAAHSLLVAQALARILRHDPDWRAKPMEPLLAALLHDVGMLGIPEEILNSSEPLTDAQRRIVEAHARTGADLARQLLPTSAWLSDAIAAHHERLDGTGYPAGLKAAGIPPLARLLAVCDVYAALLSDRPYRSGHDSRTALTDTLLLAEKGLLDRGFAERLLHISFYPPGTAVELADGAVAVVVATHQNWADFHTQARPIVLILVDGEGRPMPVPEYVDLALCEGRSIVRSLAPMERRKLLQRWFPEWA